jgi:hypothetical protein
MTRPILWVLLIGFFAAGDARPARADLGPDAWCRADRAARIEIKTSTDQVLWDYNKSEKQLNSFDIDTVNPYGNNVITDVGGLMQGGIELKETMRFKTLTHNRLQQICYWYDKVVISLHIRPTIYIAKEFPRGTCKHNAIKQHELKHINIDREIVNKYASLIGAGVKKELDRQYLFGPHHVSQAKEVEAFMKARLERVLKYYSNMMDDERKRRQQLVDSLHEYERVNQLCR